MKSWKGAGDISRRSEPRKSEAFEEENNAEDHDPVHHYVIVFSCLFYDQLSFCQDAFRQVFFDLFSHLFIKFISIHLIFLSDLKSYHLTSMQLLYQ